MLEDFWSDDFALLDLLLETNLSLADIAKELGVSQARVSQKIKSMGLGWVKRKDRKMSRGQSSLTAVMQKLFPNELIDNEFHVGNRLRLDVYCPSYKLAAEYHGRQHYDHITRFHPTYDDFLRAQRRDQDKVELCEEQGITLVVFKYNDDLSEETVYQRILAGLQKDTTSAPARKLIKNTKPTMKGNPIYEHVKAKRKEYEKELRKKVKETRHTRGMTKYI